VSPLRTGTTAINVILTTPSLSADSHIRIDIRLQIDPGQQPDLTRVRDARWTKISAPESTKRIFSSALFSIAFGAAVTLEAPAQEALRQSVAEEQAAEARRKTASAMNSSDMKLGPTVWKLNAGLRLEANDNIRLVSQPREGDLIFRPQVSADMLWPISEKNALNLVIAGGYSAYVENPQFNRWYIHPGSELSFDLYAGDFWINLHDRLSILEDSYQDPTVVGVADYALLENVVGISTSWDLNQVRLKLGYDHVSYNVLRGANQTTGRTPDGNSEVFSTSIGCALKPGLIAGAELGTSLISYAPSSSGQLFTEATELNIGCFVEARLTDYTVLSGSVGYDDFSPEPDTTAQVTGDFEGLYFRVELASRINRSLQLALSAGQNLNFSLYAGAVNLSYARLALNWSVLNKTRFSTTFNFEHGNQIGFERERFDRYGPGLSVGRELTRNLSATVSYQWYYRTSDLPERDYMLNIALLDLQYQF